MKHPPGQDLNESDKKPVTVEEVMAAQSRAIRAQQEAIDLRHKLEGLESLLAKTKETLAVANARIGERDKEIARVQSEARVLNSSVVTLEERFQKLKEMQQVLSDKRDELEAIHSQRQEEKKESDDQPEVKTDELEAATQSAPSEPEVKESVAKTDAEQPADTLQPEVNSAPEIVEQN